ncbi:hypothetical protein D9613_002655 [Agrocybe pediades]|uniref:Uncharacterized protein n=1 Tax=Agrocybe pediades TaxID=84607 RepID=A0A8H4QQZ9_9AGAR|nr:hypothetical protein D9613_002655 [Agrocybe pediades]
MFEEFCLVCGKHVEDNRAYCSEDCQNSELSSPSISSASSVLSSPNMGYAAGSDVPPLMPSALGYALNNSRVLVSMSLHPRLHQNPIRSLRTKKTTALPNRSLLATMATTML